MQFCVLNCFLLFSYKYMISLNLIFSTKVTNETGFLSYAQSHLSRDLALHINETLKMGHIADLQCKLPLSPPTSWGFGPRLYHER